MPPCDIPLQGPRQLSVWGSRSLCTVRWPLCSSRAGKFAAAQVEVDGRRQQQQLWAMPAQFDEKASEEVLISLMRQDRTSDSLWASQTLAIAGASMLSNREVLLVAIGLANRQLAIRNWRVLVYSSAMMLIRNLQPEAESTSTKSGPCVMANTRAFPSRPKSGSVVHRDLQGWAAVHWLQVLGWYG